jgi:glycosyl transferase family 2
MPVSKVLYSVVIPTRERCDVLPYSIRSVLASTRDNFELLIMDNCSADNTAGVVKSFDDPRIKYVRGESRLSMAGNWERALDHVSGDYAMVLGDDDALLPDALACAERLHQIFPNYLLAWKAPVWFWPNSIIPEWHNLLKLCQADYAEILRGEEVLRKFYAFEMEFHELPEIYNGFVPTKFIQQMKLKHGRYFLSSIPDVVSGIINAFHHPQYVFSWRPLSLAGQSHHSIGHSQGFPHIHGASAARFIEEHQGDYSVDVDPDFLVGDHMLLEGLVLDVMKKAKARFFPDHPRIQIRMKGAVQQLALSATRFGPDYNKAVVAVKKIAEKNGISPSEYPIYPSVTGPQRILTDLAFNRDRDRASFNLYLDPSLFPTVDKVAALVGAISVDLSQLRIKQPL